MFANGELIIRTHMGNGLLTPGMPPRIGFEVRYPGTTIRGYLADSLQREVYKFLRRENLTGSAILRSGDLYLDAGTREELAALRTLIELSLREGDGRAIVSEELMTR